MEETSARDILDSTASRPQEVVEDNRCDSESWGDASVAAFRI